MKQRVSFLYLPTILGRTDAPAWCVFSQTSGEAGTKDINLVVKDNSTGNTRTASMYIKCDNLSEKITVIQYPSSIKNTINITLPKGSNITSVQYAPLKYNKKMAYSFVTADGNNKPWSKKKISSV